MSETVQTCLQDYYKKKNDLKVLKATIKQEEKDEMGTNEFLDLRASIKGLRADLKDMEDEAMEELRADEGYNALRQKVLEYTESTALAREALFAKIQALPPEPKQLTFDFEGSPQTANLRNKRELYINGKLDK